MFLLLHILFLLGEIISKFQLNSADSFGWVESLFFFFEGKTNLYLIYLTF